MDYRMVGLVRKSIRGLVGSGKEFLWNKIGSWVYWWIRMIRGVSVDQD